MNLNANSLTTIATQSFECSPVSSRNLIEAEESHSRSRIEPCEFELLLQRAVEILGTRTRLTEPSRS
jgi:hypothetical protein